jgi:hypothetical protein
MVPYVLTFGVLFRFQTILRYIALLANKRIISLSRCGSTTCVGVAGAQLSVSITTLTAAVFMLQLDLRYDAALSPPPRPSDANICTAVSMVSYSFFSQSVRGFDSCTVQTFAYMNMSVCIGPDCFICIHTYPFFLKGLINPLIKFLMSKCGISWRNIQDASLLIRDKYYQTSSSSAYSCPHY